MCGTPTLWQDARQCGVFVEYNNALGRVQTAIVRHETERWPNGGTQLGGDLGQLHALGQGDRSLFEELFGHPIDNLAHFARNIKAHRFENGISRVNFTLKPLVEIFFSAVSLFGKKPGPFLVKYQKKL